MKKALFLLTMLTPVSYTHLADKQSPHDNRAENAPEQDAVLVNARNADAGKDNRHHEDIVH